MDAKCPECEKVAVLDDEITKVKCPHCNFEADYEKYLEIMKEKALVPSHINSFNDKKWIKTYLVVLARNKARHYMTHLTNQ